MYKFDEQNHIHTLDGQPLIGTSSMASVLAKPLTYWASGLACQKFGWINGGNKAKGFISKQDRLKISIPRRKEIEKLNDDEYLKLLDEAYTAHANVLKTSAQGGTDMHSLMEEYVKHCLNKNEGKPDANFKTDDTQVKILIEWSLKEVKRFMFSEVYCYSKELWLGGISDCGFEDKQGRYAILDFKSSKEVYLSQFWQCVAYALELEENGGFTKDGELVLKLEKPIDYVAVLPFGMKKPSVQTNFDMVGGKEAVKAMCTLYRKLN